MGTSAKEKVQLIPIDSSAESIAARKKIFRDCDVNGNHYLSLAEIDKGLRDVLQLPELFDTKPVLMRAWKASLKKVKSTNPLTEGLVSRGMFKWILVYMRFYYELWEDCGQHIDGDPRLNVQKMIKNKVLMNYAKVKDQDAYRQMKLAIIKEGLYFVDWADGIIWEKLKQFDDLNSHDQM